MMERLNCLDSDYDTLQLTGSMEALQGLEDKAGRACCGSSESRSQKSAYENPMNGRPKFNPEFGLRVPALEMCMSRKPAFTDHWDVTEYEHPAPPQTKKLNCPGSSGTRPPRLVQRGPPPPST